MVFLQFLFFPFGGGGLFGCKALISLKLTSLSWNNRWKGTLIIFRSFFLFKASALALVLDPLLKQKDKVILRSHKHIIIVTIYPLPLPSPSPNFTLSHSPSQHHLFLPPPHITGRPWKSEV